MSVREAQLHGRQSKPNVFYQDAGFGEFYIPANGVTYSDPRIARYFGIDAQNNADADKNWLAHDTEQVVESLDQHVMTVVVGDLGAGKSTVLYGARAELRKRGLPYVMINGHFLNRGSRLVEAVSRAATAGQVVVYDSFDYNYIKNSKQPDAKKVRPYVEEALSQHLADGGRVLATAHTEPWFSTYSNERLASEFASFLGSAGAHVYRVHGLLDAVDLQFIGTVNHGQEFGQIYPGLAAASDELTSHTYRMVKLFGLRHADEIGGFTQDSFDAAVQAIDAETRDKMGARADYPLL